ncbi:helix-turn-helix domain-containing transcriptional regulator [Pseudomonas monteilii]|jgi:DNA-binding phage protein|uniref:helix-turn-helix domain-containing transcriptional regulator n=1 Tax=Pseudomonas monteilii TaxID=76759 RepID=UPI00383B6B61
MTGTRSHKESVLEMLRNDEPFAINYLSMALEEIDEPGGAAGFVTAVRRVAEARGGMDNPNLALEMDGDPRLSTVLEVLRTLGIGLSKVVSHNR